MTSTDLLSCPWCGSSVRHGLFVCRGCHADIVYSATFRELFRTFVFTIILALFGEFLAFCAVMGRNATVPPLTFVNLTFFGAPLLAFLVVITRGLYLRGKVRFFRRGRRDF
jgi:hypothetical protein